MPNCHIPAPPFLVRTCAVKFLAQCTFAVCLALVSLVQFNFPAAAPAPVAVSFNSTSPANAAHHIQFFNPFGWSKCSAIAVGPHTLLTAAHCVIGTGFISVDGTKLVIVSTLYDEHDHMLIVVDGTAFPSTVVMEQRDPRPDEHIRIWGWPGYAESVVPREGHLLTSTTYRVPDRWQLPVFPGDSGSGLVTDNGTVITVLSTGNESAEAGTIPLTFSPEQLKAIR